MKKKKICPSERIFLGEATTRRAKQTTMRPAYRASKLLAHSAATAQMHQLIPNMRKGM